MEAVVAVDLMSLPSVAVATDVCPPPISTCDSVPTYYLGKPGIDVSGPVGPGMWDSVERGGMYGAGLVSPSVDAQGSWAQSLRQNATTEPTSNKTIFVMSSPLT